VIQTIRAPGLIGLALAALATPLGAYPTAPKTPAPPQGAAAAPGLGGPAAGATGVSAPAQAETLWTLGKADARLIEGGWKRDAKTGGWTAEVELRLVNRDLAQPFHRQVRVEFSDASGRVWLWKTFVSLPPGTAQHRRISAPRTECPGPPYSCPALYVKVDVRKEDPGERLAIPRMPLDDPDAPPAGRPLYVAAVEEGAVLRLLDGRRVRALGLRAAPGAADWVRGQAMDGPVLLTYDGLAPDKTGCWLAYVRMADGRDLGAELLRRGLAVVDAKEGFSRLDAYQAIRRDGP
jgi:hypothetical protein